MFHPAKVSVVTRIAARALAPHLRIFLAESFPPLANGVKEDDAVNMARALANAGQAFTIEGVAASVRIRPDGSIKEVRGTPERIGGDLLTDAIYTPSAAAGVCDAAITALQTLYGEPHSERVETRDGCLEYGEWVPVNAPAIDAFLHLAPLADSCMRLRLEAGFGSSQHATFLLRSGGSTGTVAVDISLS